MFFRDQKNNVAHSQRNRSIYSCRKHHGGYSSPDALFNGLYLGHRFSGSALKAKKCRRIGTSFTFSLVSKQRRRKLFLIVFVRRTWKTSSKKFLFPLKQLSK